MRTFRFFENTGGMNLHFNDVTLSSGEAEDITNLHTTIQGRWSSRNIGYVHLNDAEPLDDGAPITALYEYITLAGTTYVIAAAGEALYTIETGSGESELLLDELTGSQRMTFVTFNGLLIACNGSDAPQKWDGENAMEALDGWPPTISGITPGNPSIAAIFANRLVFSGDASNPSMLYISELENPENFTPDEGDASAGAIQVSPGDGDKITALKTLFLPLTNEEILVVFKERSTYILSGHDASSFTLQKVSGEFGAVSSQSVVIVGNEMLFLSLEGVTSISTATMQGNLTSGLISDRIRRQIQSLNRAHLSGSFALHLRHRQEVWWFVPDETATQNQTVLVYNYGINRAWSRRKGIVAASGLVMNGQVYTGAYDGVIHHQLTGNTYNGTPIHWVYRTGFHDLASPRIRKRIKDVALFLKQISNVQVTVHMYWDFQRGHNHRQTRSLTVTPNETRSLYNTAVFGQDYYSVSAGTSVFQFIPNGSGRYFQMEFTGQDADKPVEIEGWTITALYGGYR